MNHKGHKGHEGVTSNDPTKLIIGCGIIVHSVLGPGLLESAYRKCLAHEIRKRGLHVIEEQPVPLVYDGEEMDLAYRMDLLVNDIVIIEVKAVSQLLPIHEAQLISHLRLAHKRIGLLMNFHERHLKDGIRRYVN